MKYSHVCLESWECVLPDQKLLSTEIEEKLAPLCKKLKLPTGFFEIFTGIRERRMWREGTTPSEKSIKAAQLALNKQDLDPSDIDCLIHVSVSRDCLEPATASIVHHGLGLSENAMSFDMSNACLGFLNGFFTAASMIELGHIKRALIVGCENSTPLITKTIADLLNLKDVSMDEAALYLPTLTLGCGAAAMVLAHDSVAKEKHKLLGGVARSASQFNHLCRATPDTGFLQFDPSLTMKTDSNTLMKEAMNLATRTWPALKEELSWKDADINHFFTHQVGRAPREEVIKALKVSADKDYPTYEILGNMGSVSLPISFILGLEGRQVQEKDKIALIGFGSGINCLFSGLEW